MTNKIESINTQDIKDIKILDPIKNELDKYKELILTDHKNGEMERLFYIYENFKNINRNQDIKNEGDNSNLGIMTHQKEMKTLENKIPFNKFFDLSDGVIFNITKILEARSDKIKSKNNKQSINQRNYRRSKKIIETAKIYE